MTCGQIKEIGVGGHTLVEKKSSQAMNQIFTVRKKDKTDSSVHWGEPFVWFQNVGMSELEVNDD